MKAIPTIILLAAVISIVLTSGCTSSSSTTNTPTTTHTPAPAAATIAPLAYHYTGHGTQTTDTFHLNAGSAKFTFALTLNPSITLFQAYLYDSNGGLVNIVANSMSDTEITNRETILAGGDYYLKTNTQDGWTVDITE